jgi:hypothetical protein
LIGPEAEVAAPRGRCASMARCRNRRRKVKCIGSMNSLCTIVAAIKAARIELFSVRKISDLRCRH